MSEETYIKRGYLLNLMQFVILVKRTNISRTTHPINLKFLGIVLYIKEGAMNQNEVGMTIQ